MRSFGKLHTGAAGVPLPELAGDAAAVTAGFLSGGVEVGGEDVVDAAQDALLVPVSVLFTSLVVGGHGLIMRGGLPPVKSYANMVASHQGAERDMITIAAQIGTTDWQLTGIRNSAAGAKCEHCGRKLKNLYDVRNSATAEAMTIGRGCCKKVTGWTLTAAQAAQALRAAEIKARQEATWAEFTTAYTEFAARLMRDREAELRTTRTATYTGGGLVCQFYNQIRSGRIRRSEWAAQVDWYMHSLAS